MVPPQAEKNEVITLRFRAARGDDLRIRLITAVGGYDMEKERSEGEFDYYGIRWRLNDSPFHYCFEIQSDGEICYYNRCGVSKEIVEFFDFVIVRQTMWSQMSIITSADTAGK